MCQMWGIFASFLKTYSVSLDFKFWEPSLGLFGECAEHIVISNHKKNQMVWPKPKGKYYVYACCAIQPTLLGVVGQLFPKLDTHKIIVGYGLTHGLLGQEFKRSPVFMIFKESALGPILSISQNVCMSVCVFVCVFVRHTFSLRLTVFLPPLPEVQCKNFFFPLLFPKDSKNLRSLDIGLREMVAKRHLNGMNK